MNRFAQKLRALEAGVLLSIARVLRAWLPMRRWSRLIGPSGPVTEADAACEPLTGVELRTWIAVRSASRHLPFPTNCLDRAVAGSLLLRSRGRRSALVIGIADVRPGADSHAWLVGPSGRVILGGEELPGFHPVSQFGRPR